MSIIPNVPPKEYGDKRSDRSLDRHKGVKYTVYIPADMDDHLSLVKPVPMPRTQMLILALQHYLDDVDAYGMDYRTLLPAVPPRPVRSTGDTTHREETAREEKRS